MFSLNPMTAIDEGKIQQPYFYRKKKLFITGDIFIVERDNLKFEFKDVPKFLKIYVENNSREAVLFDQKLKIKSIIPEHFRGWINLNLGDSFNDKEIIIYAENIRKPIRILGFKTNDFQKTYYPWNSGFSFEKNNVKVKFNKNQLISVEGCNIEKIIDDYGTSLLSKLKCSK